MNKKCWVFREGFTTLAGADQDLDIDIVDALCVILNWREKKKIQQQEKECSSPPTST